MEIVERTVKPKRQKMGGRNAIARRRAQFWWQYGAAAPSLYKAIASYEKVLFHPFTSKFLAFAFVPTDIVFAAPHIVLTFDEFCCFALLQSNIHESWVRAYSSTLEDRMRYTPSDAFEPFPFPVNVKDCEQTGATYYQFRATLMQERGEGLTKTYNRFHDLDELSEDIKNLRDLHTRMDQAVAAAYEWDDLDLGHDFHETKPGLRFTISEPARREVLQRLLKLNHERYAEEVKQGLHDKKKSKAKKTGTPKKSKKSQPATRMLFGDDDDEEGG